MAKTIATVHKSAHLTPALDRRLAVKLAREGKTFSQFVREAAENYVGAAR